jgi:hypothetical protein
MSHRSRILRVSCLILVLLGLQEVARAQAVQFTRLTESLESVAAPVAAREAARYERFLTAVFPVKPMKRLEHVAENPVVRRVAYTVVEQQREKFIFAAFTARWRSAVNVLAIYRVSDGPIQVWRSSPWEATFYDNHLTTATVGLRTLVLFREGGEPGSFGLGSVFAFKKHSKGVYLDDLTPHSSLMRVRTRFPFRPILAQDIGLRLEDDGKPFIMLSASDQEYVLAGNGRVRPANHWRFNRLRNRFESITPARSWRPQVTTFR